MAGKKEAAGKIAQQYCKDFPTATNLGLARKMFNENKLVFNSIEHARTAIRMYRGVNGKMNRKYMKDSIVERKYIQPSDSEDWTPFIIPKSVSNLLILSDIHFPFHDVVAINTALDYAKGKGINGILINGDLFDFYKGSRFEQDPRKRGMSEEIEMGKEFLVGLKKEFNCPVYLRYGNHDERYDKYIMLKAPELFNMDGIMLEDRLIDTGVTIIKDKRIVKHGHLDTLHGHEFFGAPSQAVNPARGVFMKTLESCLIGHLHKTSSHTEMSLQGRMITTNSVGCLCYLSPEYARLNKWNHGFAINELTEGSNYITHNKRIFRNKVF